MELKLMKIEFGLESPNSYPCFTCGENMGEYSGEWMYRGEVWELCLGVEQENGSKRANCLMVC